MFTATLIGDTKNIDLRRRMINVEFTNGTVTFAKEFQFKTDETVETIKKTVASYLTEINLPTPELTGEIADAPAETPPTPPTQAELDQQAWEVNFAKLEKVQRLINTGVLTGDEAPIVTLRNKVKTEFKQSYL